MLMNMIARVAAVILCVLIFSGCAKKTNQTPPPEEPVKTEAEYKAEAQKEINEQNMTQELDKLEQDVNTDAGTTP